MSFSESPFWKARFSARPSAETGDRAQEQSLLSSEIPEKLGKRWRDMIPSGKWSIYR